MQYNYIPPGYVPFSFDDLASIIAVTQLSTRLIKKEHKLLSNFYKNNEELLYEHLEERLDVLEGKKECDDLTEFEDNELIHLYRLLDDKRPVDELFEFQTDFLLDNYQKVWIQLGKKGVDFLKQNEVVDIVHYAIEERNINECSVGERFNDGSVNTGSRLVLRVLRVNHKSVITQYKMLCN